MERVLPIVIGLVLLLALGFVDAMTDILALARRHRFTHDYQGRWIGFVRDYENDRGDPNDYIWLTRNQPAMSGELGHEGIIVYRAPYGTFTSSSYPILPNTLARVRDGRVHPVDLENVDHILITHEGALAHLVALSRGDLRNPIALLRRGFQFILGLPLRLLAWSGLVSDASVRRARQSVLFRLLQFLAGLVVLFSAFETAVIGWPAFVTQLRQWTGLPLH